MLRASVIQYCSEIGADPLLVQGAGGNISWKVDEVLWVKASGTWLVDAEKKDIFLPVDLKHLRESFLADDFSVYPKVLNNTDLRPSIETLLHALMPHRLVVHLHAVEILAHLVRFDCYNQLKTCLGGELPWAMVDYYKPGRALAEAVMESLNHTQEAKVIFLKNHGVVIGGEDVRQIHETLRTLLHHLSIQKCKNLSHSDVDLKVPMKAYAPFEDTAIHQLALDPAFLKRVREDWALYPDHVVFLGAKAHVYQDWKQLQEMFNSKNDLPELVFIENQGVFILNTFSENKKLQLRCFYEVIIRQNDTIELTSLSPHQIAELLNWDAEKYRLSLLK